MIKTTPMEQQAKALVACSERPYYAYFMEPGMGKTWTIIAEVDSLAEQKLVDTVIVVCPKSIISVWAEEIATHSSDHKVYVWDGGFNKVLDGKGPIWWVINIDAVNKTKTSHVGYDTITYILSKTTKAMMVIDESTIIKNVDSKRTKAVTALGKQCLYRRILTGTPVANTPLDIFAQMMFLSPSIFPHSKNFFAFRARYAVMGGYQMRQVVGYKNQEQLAEIIGKHSFRATKAEYLDLPERTTQVRYVELSKDSWKAYRHFVDEVAIELEDSVMTMDQVVKKISKLRQLTGGWVKNDEGDVYRVGGEKFHELEHLLDECSGQKVIIWVAFKHELFAIQDAYPQAKVYYGAMTTKARDEARHAFMDRNSGCDIIVIQNETGSMGLTLTAASVVIFYSNPVYPLTKDQSRCRAYRKGQDKPITEYELIVKDSVDEAIYNALMNKISLAEAIMDATDGNPCNVKALQNFIAPHKRVDWKSPKRGL